VPLAISGVLDVIVIDNATGVEGLLQGFEFIVDIVYVIDFDNMAFRDVEHVIDNAAAHEDDDVLFGFGM